MAICRGCLLYGLFAKVLLSMQNVKPWHIISQLLNEIPFFPTKIEINYISLHDIALDISLSKRGVSYIYEYHIGE
jgi:hypothetical protein